jgi:hypothetical protein
MLLLVLAFAVSGCASAGRGNDCSGKAIRFTEAEIAMLSDQSVEDILNHNETGAKNKCYVPNK